MTDELTAAQEASEMYFILSELDKEIAAKYKELNILQQLTYQSKLKLKWINLVERGDIKEMIS